MPRKKITTQEPIPWLQQALDSKEFEAFEWKQRIDDTDEEDEDEDEWEDYADGLDGSSSFAQNINRLDIGEEYEEDETDEDFDKELREQAMEQFSDNDEQEEIFLERNKLNKLLIKQMRQFLSENSKQLQTMTENLPKDLMHLIIDTMDMLDDIECTYVSANQLTITKGQSYEYDDEMSEFAMQHICNNISKKQKAAIKQEKKAKMKELFGSASKKANRNNPPKRSKTAAPKQQPIKEVGKDAPAIGRSNMGHMLLSKMGWKSGGALGKSVDGIKDPIKAVVLSRGKGLGAK